MGVSKVVCKIFSMSVFAAISLVTSQSVMAKTYSYRAVLSQADERGEQCPKSLSLQIQENEKSGKSQLAIDLSSVRAKAVLNSSYESTQCFSDIFCNTDVNYQGMEDASIALTRNNDRNYPTTNLPGFSNLKVSLGRTFLKDYQNTAFCNYDLK